MTGVAAAIPAFQAAASVAEVARRAAATVPHVLVVDDGSSDGTGEAAARAGARVLRVPVNRGKGHALKVAFEALFAEAAKNKEPPLTINGVTSVCAGFGSISARSYLSTYGGSTYTSRHCLHPGRSAGARA